MPTSPDIIGQTIGGIIADGVASADAATPAANPQDQAAPEKSGKANAVAKPSEATAASGGSPLSIDKVLGAEAAALATKTPSLTADLTALEKDGWAVKIGSKGGGTYADRPTKTITIDGDNVGNAADLIQAISHEVGHGTYKGALDFSSKEKYLKTQLADEGAATMSNIRVQREIIAAGGSDIGIAGNPANHKDYNAAYDQYLKDGNVAKARDIIGSTYAYGEHTSTPGNPTYYKYYGDWYDKAFPPPPPTKK